MRQDHSYCVYILANKWNTVTYTGITNRLVRRIYEHREHLVDGFTKRYQVTKLVYFETFATAIEAIEREKQLKAGPRKQKVALIKRTNPGWRDLYDEIAA